MKTLKRKCKIFIEALLQNLSLEEQINMFFEENDDIEIEYIVHQNNSVLIIYKTKQI